jgi:hypothetical protein
MHFLEWLGEILSHRNINKTEQAFSSVYQILWGLVILAFIIWCIFALLKGAFS